MMGSIADRRSKPKFQERLIELGYSFYRARVVHAAFELGIFASIGKSLVSAETVARQLSSSPRGMELLLNALVSLDLLEKEKGRYRNKKEALEVCLPGGKKYTGDLMDLQRSGWESWSNLVPSVVKGAPYEGCTTVAAKLPAFSSPPLGERMKVRGKRKPLKLPPSPPPSPSRRERGKDCSYGGAPPYEIPPFLRENHEATRKFTLAMHNTATGHARELARRVSLARRRHLLDVGGGSGAFTVYFLEANPKLMGTIFELPGTLPFTKEVVGRYGLDGRVSFQAGDFTRDPIQGEYDVIFLSHIIHGLGGEENRRLLKKLFGVLKDGGEILIQDFFLDQNLASPEFPALFSLNMLLHTQEGRSYSFAETEAWLREAGFSRMTRLPFYFPRSIRILRGVK